MAELMQVHTLLTVYMAVVGALSAQPTDYSQVGVQIVPSVQNVGHAAFALPLIT